MAISKHCLFERHRHTNGFPNMRRQERVVILNFPRRRINHRRVAVSNTRRAVRKIKVRPCWKPVAATRSCRRQRTRSNGQETIIMQARWVATLKDIRSLFDRGVFKNEKHLGVRVVDHLARLVREDRHAPVALHSQRLVAHVQAACRNKTPPRGCACAAGWRVSAARARAARPCHVGTCSPNLPVHTIHARVGRVVRDLHQVGQPPAQVIRLDEMVTLDGFHGLNV